MLAVDRIAKNSFFNIISGIISAIVTVALPPVLIRALGRDEFTAWVFILQLGAYLGYLNLGLQTAISRYVAMEDSGDDEKIPANEILNSGVLILTILGCVGVVVVVLVANYIPFVHDSIPATMREKVLGSLPWVLLCFAMLLPLSGINGFFVGKRINSQVLVNNMALKGGVMFLLPLVAFFTSDMTYVTMAYVGAHVIAGMHYYFLLKNGVGGASISARYISRRAIKSLVYYCAGFSVWSLSMLLVSGVALSIVARFDYMSLASYSMILSLIALVTGFHGAIFNNLLPEFSAILGRNNPAILGNAIVETTKVSTIILLAIGLPLFYFEPTILNFWMGAAYVKDSYVVLVILSAGTLFRLTSVPYSMHLLATNQQRLGMITAFSEGVSNLLVSYFFSQRFGAVGVALGMVIGGVVGVSGNVLFNFRKDKMAVVVASKYIIKGIVLPVMLVSPTIIFVLFFVFNGVSKIGFDVFSFVFSLFLLYWIGFDRVQKQKIFTLSKMLVAKIR